MMHVGATYSVLVTFYKAKTYSQIFNSILNLDYLSHRRVSPSMRELSRFYYLIYRWGIVGLMQYEHMLPTLGFELDSSILLNQWS